MSRGEVYAEEGVVRSSDCSIEHDITFEVNVAVSPTLEASGPGLGLKGSNIYHGASTPVYCYTKSQDTSTISLHYEAL